MLPGTSSLATATKPVLTSPAFTPLSSSTRRTVPAGILTERLPFETVTSFFVTVLPEMTSVSTAFFVTAGIAS